uniref:Uncharacterized protein n=1 Tax=Oryza brachyantha TaxID=4533 RepID=J3LXX4_ORYBR
MEPGGAGLGGASSQPQRSLCGVGNAARGRPEVLMPVPEEDAGVDLLKNDAVLRLAAMVKAGAGSLLRPFMYGGVAVAVEPDEVSSSAIGGGGCSKVAEDAEASVLLVSRRHVEAVLMISVGDTKTTASATTTARAMTMSRASNRMTSRASKSAKTTAAKLATTEVAVDVAKGTESPSILCNKTEEQD